mmetsp:Transcript_25524/g.35829  ORF Transcript_25524/g.35829 Transcript_25524/m.35829 type:complete len:123 (+) Transcript_25524:64-432(+)
MSQQSNRDNITIISEEQLYPDLLNDSNFMQLDDANKRKQFEIISKNVTQMADLWIEQSCAKAEIQWLQCALNVNIWNSAECLKFMQNFQSCKEDHKKILEKKRYEWTRNISEGLRNAKRASS